nr:hypothetical protein GCM10017745_35720 [Saccharothrix mutabilis subsp. capreolus]
MISDRHVRWMDLVRDLLKAPLVKLPHSLLLTELADTLGAKAGSWIVRKSDGHVDYRLWAGVPDVLPEDEVILWMQAHIDEHPLVNWFAVTGDPAAQTLGRVPASLVDVRYEAWRDVLGPLEVEHQLSLPLLLQGPAFRTFVLVSQGGDFTDEDVRLARTVQGLLAGLERQAHLLARWLPAEQRGECDVALTGRELAVLGLVAGGLTAGAIGRHLMISPRTVQKHLEHAYSKLRTRDKVSAVLRAQALGLLPRQSDGSHT